MNKEKKFISLKLKLTVTLFTILLLVMSIQLLANYIFAENYYIDSKKKIIERSYAEILQVAAKSNKNIVEIMSKYENNNGIQYVIANNNYICIYNSKQYSINGKNRYKIKSGFNFEKNAKLFTTDAKVHLKETKNKKDRLLLYGIIERGEEDYYILIRSYLEGIRQDMAQINIFITAVSAIALLIGGLSIYYFTKRITKPIENIDQVAIHVSDLDFSLRAKELHSNDELSRLAGNINRMADKLQDDMSKLMDLNHILALDNQYKQRIDNSRKEFVSNVSHELKTPLAVLTGYAEMLKNNINGIDHDYYCDVILDEANRMTDLVKKLLGISHMEHSLAKMKREIVNLSELTSDIITKDRPLLQNKDISCSFDCSEEYYVMGDAMYLEQAISNYISNAVKYTEHGGEIIVTLKSNSYKVELSVYNEGSHLNEDEIEHIWESFYRGDKARSREDDSVGLGLYIVSSIINAHQGDYGAYNTETGIVFWFRLPDVD